MEGGVDMVGGGVEKKRGRKKKSETEKVVVDKEKSKFFVDLSDDQKTKERIFSFLEKVNSKEFGKTISFKDMVLYSFEKLTEKDLTKLQEDSLTEMEKVERTLKEYNEKNGLNLTLGEYLVKKLGIN